MAPQRVILISCGSYNPPTNMHLRMFELARDHLHRMGTHKVIGGVISPVHDSYFRKELVLASSSHRCKMLKLALHSSDWIRLSTWEVRQNSWTKTRATLQHHQNLLNSVLQNANLEGNFRDNEDMEWIPANIENDLDSGPIQIKLLCGGDLLESFAVPNLWMEEDINEIVGQHGLVVITREGSEPHKFISDSDILYKYINNIFIITEWITNEISSSKVRRALKRGESIKYLTPDLVIDYIYKNELYDARKDSQFKLKVFTDNANHHLNTAPSYENSFLTPSPSDFLIQAPLETISTDVSNSVLKKNFENSRYASPKRGLTIENGRSQNKIICVSSNGNQIPSSSKDSCDSAKESDSQISEQVASKESFILETKSSRSAENKVPTKKKYVCICDSQMSLYSSTENFLNKNDVRIDVSSDTNAQISTTSEVSNAKKDLDSSVSNETMKDVKTEPDNHAEDSTKRDETDGKYSRSLVNSRKASKSQEPWEEYKRRSSRARRKEIESRRSSSESYASRYKKFLDDDEEASPIVRSSIAKKPLRKVPSMDETKECKSIFLQSSLDLIDVDVSQDRIGDLKMTSKKSKSFESIKPGDGKLSLPKTDITQSVSGTCKSSGLVTTSDFDMPTEEFCFVCYLPNDPSSGDDDDSTKCDICSSWNFQADAEVAEENENTENPFETCEICGEPAAGFEEEPVTLDKVEGEEDSFEIENCGSKADEGSTPMGKIAKDVARKGSIMKRTSERDGRLYASVDSLQFSKLSLRMSGDKLVKFKDTKHMTSADNIRAGRGGSFRRSVDNIGRCDSSGDNLDSLVENYDKENEEMENGAKKRGMDSETIESILTKHGIKIISGKETVL